MTTLDALAIVLLALAAGLGALSGALRPLFLAAGAALGWLASSRLSAPLGRAWQRVLPAPTGESVAGVILFAAPVLLGGLLGRSLRRRPGGERRSGDRAAGALLGGTAAGLVAWMALSVLGATSRLLPAGWRGELDRSDLAALVREHDLGGPWRRPAEQALGQLLRLAAAPNGAAAIARDPALSGLAGDERVKELLEEAAGGRSANLEETARGLKLLSDPAFRERLERSQNALDRAMKDE